VVQVSAGPGDQGGAGRGYLRASHADREHVVGMLKAAFVQGRLTKGELDDRVGQTLASRTYGELAALTADLPPRLIAAPPAQRRPARARPPVSKVVAVGLLVIPAPAVVAANFITGSDALVPFSFLTVMVYLMAWIVTGAQLIVNWHDRRSQRRLPPRAQGGQTLEGKPGSRPGNDLILCEANGDTRTPHLPGSSITGRIRRSLPSRASAGMCT
jgi:uncharacterized protein DUF1707